MGYNRQIIQDQLARHTGNYLNYVLQEWDDDKVMCRLIREELDYRSVHADLPANVSRHDYEAAD